MEKASLDLFCTLAVKKVQNKSVFATIMSVAFLQSLLAAFFPPFDTEKGESLT